MANPLPADSLTATPSGPDSGAHWAATRERGALLWLRFMQVSYRLLGRRVCGFFLYFAITYFFLFARAPRRASRKYWARYAGTEKGRRTLGHEPTWRDSYRQFLEFGNASMDKFASWAGGISKGQDTAWVNEDVILSRAMKGQGGIIMGAHLGNLEILRALSSRHPELKVHALMLTQHAERFNRVLMKANPEVFKSVIFTNEIGPETALLLRQKIEEGGYVAILADRVAEGTPDRVSWAPFLGAPAPFPQGPFILAGLLKAPVYLMFCLRQNMKLYHIYIEHFSEGLEFPRDRRQQAIQEAVARYAERLEDYCHLAPHQWFNFYDFWAVPEEHPPS